MTRSARFAWWWLILLFCFFILLNSLIFLYLFTRSSRVAPIDKAALFEIGLEVRQAVAFTASPLLVSEFKSSAESAARTLQDYYGTDAEWEARLYVALLERSAGFGDPARTLQPLADSPSIRLTAPERRWYAALWQDALLSELSADRVARLRDALEPSAPPLALQLAESVMWKRVGDNQKAQAVLHTAGWQSVARVGLMGVLFCCGGLLGIAGVGLFIWYLVQRFPLPARPFPEAPPDALDPALHALAAFFIFSFACDAFFSDILSLTPEWRRYYSEQAASALLYSLAALLSVGFLVLPDERAPSHWLSLRWRWRTDAGATLAGLSIYLPLAALAALLVSLILPDQQTNPMADQLVSAPDPLAFWTLVFHAVLFGPFIEEVLFRGVLFQALWQHTGRVWLSALVSGFLFAIVHPQFLSGLLHLALLGTVLAIVYAHTRSLLPCIILHALNNSAVVLMAWMLTS